MTVLSVFQALVFRHTAILKPTYSILGAILYEHDFTLGLLLSVGVGTLDSRTDLIFGWGWIV